MQRKGPLPGKIFTRCILRRRFAGHFGCMARISCQSQPVFGCVARESCRELAVFPPEAAFGMRGAKKIATDCRPGTHRGGILPRQDPRERIAREYCHCQSGQERIRAQSCHRRTLGNAFRERFAIVERLGTYQGIILPRPDAHAERPVRPCATASAWPTAVAPSAPPFAYVTRHPDAAELRVLQAVRALAVAQPADCRVAAERVVNIAKLVSVPQRRSARHHAPRCHAPQRHNAMRCNIA